MTDKTHDDHNGDDTDDTDDLDDLDQGPEVITLESEDGEETDFGLLGVFSLDDVEYAALVPAAQLEEETDQEVELYVFRYREDDDGGRVFEAIEDDALEQRVFETAVAFLDAGGEE